MLDRVEFVDVERVPSLLTKKQVGDVYTPRQDQDRSFDLTHRPIPNDDGHSGDREEEHRSVPTDHRRRHGKICDEPGDPDHERPLGDDTTQSGADDHTRRVDSTQLLDAPFYRDDQLRQIRANGQNRQTYKALGQAEALAQPDRSADRELSADPQSENAEDEKDEGHLAAGRCPVRIEHGEVDVLVRQRIQVRRPDEGPRSFDDHDRWREAGLIEAPTEVHT